MKAKEITNDQHRRTLPSNLALCVHPDFEYVKAKDPGSGKVYLVAESRLAELPGAVPKAKKVKKGTDEAPHPTGFQVLHPVTIPVYYLLYVITVLP